MRLCNDHGLRDLDDVCIRSFWASVIPLSFIIVLCALSLPKPRFIRPALSVITDNFRPFLDLHEAEALDAQEPTSERPNRSQDNDAAQVPLGVPLWRTVMFSLVGITQTIAWTVAGAYRWYETGGHVALSWASLFPFSVALAWLYSGVRPIVRPVTTSPLDLFTLYCILFATALLQLGGQLYNHSVDGAPLPSLLELALMGPYLVTLLVLLGIVLAMPLGVPSTLVNTDDIGRTVSPEDYTPLLGWITFGWVYPLVKRGRYETLNPKDVWNLSPTMQARPLFLKFNTIRRSTLFRRLWAANSLDLILDFSLTIVSVVLSYAGPFFLKLILDEIDTTTPTQAGKTRAYIYALAAFVCATCKVQTDLQHLWYGRRLATRIRAELMTAVYDKALKRKDYSGVVTKGQEGVSKADGGKDKPTKAKSPGGKPTKQDDGAKKKKDQEDDPKAGADVGKIVNLMSGDTTRISGIVSGAYVIYGAPVEIVLASVFLYQLLGLSAFAGFIAIIIGWPLNNFLARRRVRIHKGTLAARDKRMSVLNELISAMKFIKFFAWEERWIDRASEAREVEIQWMVKSRINAIFFQALWTTGPILVSVISFSAYVMLGHQLTIGTAFTALALFSMIRAPLNVIPTWIVQFLQAGVALKRIAVYLDEEEVTDQVSSLKRPPVPSSSPSEGLGFDNASFKWNEVPEEPEAMDKKKAKKSASTSTSHTLLPTTSSEDEGASTLADSASERNLSDSGDRKFELNDLDLVFPEGELTVVTGPTASGKTALLLAMLGEMTLTKGRIVMSKEPWRVDENGLRHAISYAAQVPWLRHQSIKDNILFEDPYDEARYKEVVECCALGPDFEMLEDGDLTEIGARGVNLSGGQKARVALARAVYTRTKYVLLDDPLSAVDSHTSRILYEKLLKGPLLANRTVILVTHHVDLVLPGAHYLVRMLDGRIDTHGTVKDLRARGVLDEIKHGSAAEAAKEEADAAEAEALEEGAEQSNDQPKGKKKLRKLVKDEHRETGSVKWSIYATYIKASSYWTWVLIIFFIFARQFLGLAEKIWIMIWGTAYNEQGLQLFTTFISEGSYSATEATHAHQPHHFEHYTNAMGQPTPWGIRWPSATEHPMFYVGIYALIGMANGLSGVLSSATQYSGALRASRILFKRLLVTVVRATFRFHDTTPQGRMLNRFGKDIETIDGSLGSSLQNVNSALANFAISILTIAFVFPWFLVPAFFLGFIYRELAVGYLNTGRDLRRMESNSRSPIYSDFGEMLEGIVTVRAFSAERHFLNRLYGKIDHTTKMWYTFWMTNRWLLFNFDTLGALTVLITMLFAITNLSGEAGWAGVCITSAMSFTTSVYWACRFWTTLELDLNAVERVVEYLDLPQEAPAIIEANRPPAYWPSNVHNPNMLVVENLSIKYAPELPPVLHDVSFALASGERVGLLGRTGSGKSTLAMSILRFVDPASGRIVIDGVDISKIGTYDLRSRLTFIPQDATLFSGTVRDNLDPFNEHTDAECLDVLRRVHMISDQDALPQSHGPSSDEATLSSRPASPHRRPIASASETASTALTNVDSTNAVKLTSKVSTGGNNFSQGQRQLLAMARALLRRSPIIVLDEATSSIDFETDAKIQATIREEFNDSLLLTVAHRLRTVIDYDRLIVLDKGQIAESDTPWNLLQKEEGIFKTMCLKSGSYTELEATAKAKALAS